MTKYFKSSFLSIEDSNFIKGVGIILIAFHNFFHHIAPYTGENEFDFNIVRVQNFWHGIVANPLNFIDLAFSYFGHYGVQLFILISGYGLMRAYGRGKLRWGAFMAKRLNKLYPTYFFALIFVAIFYFLWDKTFYPFLEYFLKITFASNFIPGRIFSLNGPWWFYGMIVELYALFPLLLKVHKKFPKYGLAVVASAAYAVLLVWGDFFVSIDQSLYYHFVGNLPVFSFGMWLASKEEIKLKAFWIPVAALVFVLGNFYGKVFYFSHLSIVVLLFTATLSIQKKLKDGGRLKRIILFYGEISMYLFAVHGFLREIFIRPADMVSNTVLRPFTTLAAALLFFLFSTLIALILRYLVSKWSNFISALSERLETMKKSRASFVFFDFGEKYLRISAAYFIVIFLIRYFDFVLLSHNHAGLPYDMAHAMTDSFRDVLMAAAMSGLLFVPYYLLALLSVKFTRILVLAVNSLLLISYLALVFYFDNSLIPLDQVIFVYTPKDLISIINSSGGFNLLYVLSFVVAILLYIMALLLTKRMFPKRVAVFGFVFTGLILSAFHHAFYADINDYPSEMEYYCNSNKLAYFTRKTAKNLYEIKNSGRDKNIVQEIIEYQSFFPEKKFVSKITPFLYENPHRDVLSKYFRKTDDGRPPDIVFVLVESLSHPVSGKYAGYASFTPFLDSLAGQSLYWPNTLSSGERTFQVLPAVLGSLPLGGKRAFVDLGEDMPYFIDFVTIMGMNNYLSHFFYGGWAHFNNMDTYFIKDGMQEIVSDYPEKRRMPENAAHYSWGFEDGAIFDASFGHFDDSLPDLSVFLTLNTHEPFMMNNKEPYVKKAALIAEKIKNQAVRKAVEDEIEKTATFVYFDESLKKFFAEYQKRHDFKRTIFIITGDHMSHIFPQKSNLAKYHVPLIIYSPLLKSPREFKAAASHIDIAPSLLGMLEKQYDIMSPSKLTFTGDMLDTAKDFRCRLSMPFVRNSREIDEYIDKGFFLAKGKLFAVSDNFEITPAHNDSIKNLLEKKLSVTYRVGDYALNMNKIIPRSVYVKSIGGVNLLKFKTDFENIHRKEFAPYITEAAARSGKRCIRTDSSEFTPVSPTDTLRSSYSKIYADVSFYVKVKNKGKKNPLVVISAIDSKGKPFYWTGVDFIKQQNLKEGEWRKVRFVRSVPSDKLSDAGSVIKIYIWQQDQASQLFIDDVEVKISGLEGT